MRKGARMNISLEQWLIDFTNNQYRDMIDVPVAVDIAIRNILNDNGIYQAKLFDNKVGSFPKSWGIKYYALENDELKIEQCSNGELLVFNSKEKAEKAQKFYKEKLRKTLQITNVFLCDEKYMSYVLNCREEYEKNCISNKLE